MVRLKVEANRKLLQFSMQVSAVENLVGHMQETGRLADRPREEQSRGAAPLYDTGIPVAHLQNR